MRGGEGGKEKEMVGNSREGGMGEGKDMKGYGKGKGKEG